MEDTTVVSEDEKLAQKAKEEADAAKLAAEEAKTVYQKELERLQTEKEAIETEAEKQKTILRQKNGALAEEKEKTKAAEAAAKALVETAKISDEEINKKLDERFASEKFNRLVEESSADPDEQALIKHHYNTSIVKTGNVEADLKMALAIANAHLVGTARQAQIEREAQEAVVAGFHSGKNSSGRPVKPAYETNPTLKSAAALLERLGAKEAIKNLK